MNEQIEHCLYQSGLTAQGCWDELDDYARECIEKFAELIVQDIINTALVKARWYQEVEKDDNTVMALCDLVKDIREEYGVEE